MRILKSAAPRLAELKICYFFTGMLLGDETLLPEEFELVRDSNDTRRKEFATGRYCARQALSGLGYGPGVCLPRGPFREPVFPHGTVGSISHTDGLTCAVAGDSAQFRAIGVDVQILGRPVSADAAGQILNPEEEFWKSVPDGILTVFSLKEAFFKMTRRLTDMPFWFDRVSVFPGETNGSVEYHFETPRGKAFHPGEYRIENGYVFSLSFCAKGHSIPGITPRT
ncbi:MAG: hypothetical protein A2Y33_07960 [Spirochaetes bacterium GWF1_51_8]|nr:MAG: hypothetical protein A2Y33_07960 [Spirochaetes bacterium GWF1_51_8]